MKLKYKLIKIKEIVMRTLRTFADSAISMIQEGMNEIGRMIQDFDMTSIVDDMVEFNNSIRNEFDKIKQRIRNLDDKFIVDVVYDREVELLSFSIENNTLTVRVNSDPDSKLQSQERIISATLPRDVNVTTMKSKYDSEEKKMLFIFKKNKTANTPNTENEVEDNTTTTEAPNFVNETNTENVVVEPMEPEVENNSTNEVNVEQETPQEVHQENQSIFDNKTYISSRMKAMRDEGLSYRKIGEEFGVSDKTVARWIRNYENGLA